MVRAIERIGIHYQAKNPPIAGWAWLSSALVHCSKRQYGQALQAAVLVKSTAQTYQLRACTAMRWSMSTTYRKRRAISRAHCPR